MWVLCARDCAEVREPEVQDTYSPAGGDNVSEFSGEPPTQAWWGRGMVRKGNRITAWRSLELPMNPFLASI